MTQGVCGTSRRVTHYHEVQAQTVVNRTRNVYFAWSVNPYRGCIHACTYCYARASHAFLGFGPGEDFEREILVKVNAPEVMRRELRQPALRGETLTFGTVTDPYQPAETRYRLTRQLLRVAGEAGNPVTITTKSTIVTQDLPLLAQLARRSGCAVNMTITTLDADIARRLEPRTPRPEQRLGAIAALAQAGVPVGLFLAPILPGITDGPGALEALIEQAAAHGAGYLISSAVRIGRGFADPLLQAVARDFPEVHRRYQRQADAGGYLSDIELQRLKVRVGTARVRAGLASGPPRRPNLRPIQLPLPLRLRAA